MVLIKSVPVQRKTTLRKMVALQGARQPQDMHLLVVVANLLDGVAWSEVEESGAQCRFVGCSVV